VADLVPLRQKLAKCIRLLNSNRDGEVTAALDALKRTLMGGNADLNDLADYVENPQLTEDQMKNVFDAAVVAVEQKLSAANGHGSPIFNGAGGNMPTLQDMVLFCFDHIDNLRRLKDQEFIRDIHERAIWRFGGSPKQRAWIEDLFLQLGGGRP
jgi:hypothetical protein